MFIPWLMWSFRIHGKICGVWPSPGVVVEGAAGSCFCVRGVAWLACAPSSGSEETFASSVSAKCVLLLLRLLLLVMSALLPPVVVWSDEPEVPFRLRLSLLVQGRASGEASEQLVWRYRVSVPGFWKARPLSPTVPKWALLLERFTLRSIPL